jgi:hypothetical protein
MLKQLSKSVSFLIYIRIRIWAVYDKCGNVSIELNVCRTLEKTTKYEMPSFVLMSSSGLVSQRAVCILLLWKDAPTLIVNRCNGALTT